MRALRTSFFRTRSEVEPGEIPLTMQGGPMFGQLGWYREQLSSLLGWEFFIFIYKY